jgi:hypothetical protein
MFISKAEKHNLYKLIADLQLRVNALETAALAQPKSTVPMGDEAYALYKKEYSKQYYWRKKAERLAKGSNEAIRSKKPAEESK